MKGIIAGDAKFGDEVSRGNDFLVELFAEALDSGSGIEHIAGIGDVSFDNPDFTGDNLATMDSSFKRRDHPIALHIFLPETVDLCFDVEETVDAFAVFNAIFIFPGHDHLVAHVLIDFSFIVDNGVGDVAEEVFEQFVVFLIAQLFGNCG
ncbi:hypothetical protein D3C86_1599300 [compost metagenome]